MFLSVCSCSVMGFILTSICVFMVSFSPAARATGTLPLLTPDSVTGGEQERLELPYLHLPVFRHFKKPRVDKRHFAPAQVKSRGPLPERVRQVLVPEPRRRLKTRVRPNGPVSVTCNPREMRVRVHTAHLREGGERVHVRLGTCDVSRSTEQSVLFQYELHECGTQRQIINNTIVYSNLLHYTSDASVSASETFSVPVQCHFNRFHYSYKIGFLPSVERVKFFKPMKTKGSVTLTACDAQWNRLSPAEGFVIGKPMYFEAETLYVPDDERLFVHFCHVTTDSSRVSTPQVNIINNYGCLIVSKSSSLSTFINSTRRNVVRFTVDAFTLQGKVPKYLFIHCEMSIRSIVPTETSKSCTYNQLELRWEELHGADSVCSCCDSSCVPEIPTLIRPLASELGAVVKQHPEGKSRNIPTLSPEETFTPEILHNETVPERTHTPENKHRAVTMQTTPTSTPMPEREHAVTLPDSEHGNIATETTLTLEDEHGMLVPDTEHGKITPKDTSDHGTLTNNEHAILTSESDRGEITPVSTPTLEAEHAILTSESDRGEITPVSTPTLETEHAILTSESDHGEITPVSTPTLEAEHGILVLDSELVKITLENTPPSESAGDPALETPPTLETLTLPTLETPPTLESEHTTLMPEGELGMQMPDTDQEKISPYPHEAVSPVTFTPSVTQTLTPGRQHTELQEPYRIFEEVFGLS